VDGIADAAGNIDEMQLILVFVVLLDICFCYDADMVMQETTTTTIITQMMMQSTTQSITLMTTLRQDRVNGGTDQSKHLQLTR
jgi:hypothetical protein